MKKKSITALLLFLSIIASSSIWAENGLQDSGNVGFYSIYSTLKINMTLPPGVSYILEPQPHMYVDNKSDDSIKVSNRNYNHRAHGGLTIIDKLDNNNTICRYTISLMSGNDITKGHHHSVLHVENNIQNRCLVSNGGKYSTGTVSTRSTNGTMELKVEAKKSSSESGNPF